MFSVDEIYINTRHQIQIEVHPISHLVTPTQKYGHFVSRSLTELLKLVYLTVGLIAVYGGYTLINVCKSQSVVVLKKINCFLLFIVGLSEIKIRNTKC